MIVGCREQEIVRGDSCGNGAVITVLGEYAWVRLEWGVSIMFKVSLEASEIYL